MVALGLVLTISTLIFYTTYTLRESSIKAAEKEAMLTAQLFAQDMALNLEDKLSIVRTLAQVFSTVPDKEYKVQLNRGEVGEILRSVLESTHSFDAIFTAWEPNAFDGKDSSYVNANQHREDGKFNPYFARNTKGELFTRAVVPHGEDTPENTWYWTPKKTKKTLLDEPFLFPIDGKMTLMSGIVAPVVINNSFKGIVSIDYGMSFMQAMAEKFNMYDGEAQLIVVTHRGTIAAYNKDAEMVGKKLSVLFPDISEENMEEVRKGESKMKTENDYLVVLSPLKIGESNEFWQIQIRIPFSKITEESSSKTLYMIIIGLVLLLFGLGITVYFVMRIMKPLYLVTEISEQVASGNLDSTRYDEANMDNMAISLLNMIKKLQHTVGNIVDNSEKTLASSYELTLSSQDLSHNSGKQAVSLEEVSATMEQMLLTIQQNTDNAKATEQTSLKMQQGASEVQEKVRASIESSNLINEKITIINEIASQTNILALNAAVEAARAGKHGQGFAVVAAEVRKLAERSKTAAEEIVNLSQNTVDLSNKAGESLSAIIPEIEKTVGLVQQIAKASIYQNSGAEQINGAIQELNSVAQNNVATSEKMAQTSEEMKFQSEELKEAVSYFSI